MRGGPWHHQNHQRGKNHARPHGRRRRAAPEEREEHSGAERQVHRQHHVHDREEAAHEQRRGRAEHKHRDNRAARIEHSLRLRERRPDRPEDIAHKERRNREGLGRERRHRAGEHAREHQAHETGAEQAVGHRAPHLVRIREATDPEKRHRDEPRKGPQHDHDSLEVVAGDAAARGKLVLRRAADAHVVAEARVLHDAHEQDRTERHDGKLIRAAAHEELEHLGGHLLRQRTPTADRMQAGGDEEHGKDDD